jgi:hypothetical protein
MGCRASTGLTLLQVLHATLFAGWLIATTVTANEPAWFLAGSLGFSTACIFVVVAQVTVVRDASLRVLNEVRRATPPAARSALDAIDAVHVPLFDRRSAMVLLTCAVLGLAPIAWYFVNAITAKTQPLLSSDGTTRALAKELWANNPGSTITMLVLLSATALVHLIDIVVASVIIADCNVCGTRQSGLL